MNPRQGLLGIGPSINSRHRQALLLPAGPPITTTHSTGRTPLLGQAPGQYTVGRMAFPNGINTEYPNNLLDRGTWEISPLATSSPIIGTRMMARGRTPLLMSGPLDRWSTSSQQSTPSPNYAALNIPHQEFSTPAFMQPSIPNTGIRPEILDTTIWNGIRPNSDTGGQRYSRRGRSLDYDPYRGRSPSRSAHTARSISSLERYSSVSPGVESIDQSRQQQMEKSEEQQPEKPKDSQQSACKPGVVIEIDLTEENSFDRSVVVVVDRQPDAVNSQDTEKIQTEKPKESEQAGGNKIAEITGVEAAKLTEAVGANQLEETAIAENNTSTANENIERSDTTTVVEDDSTSSTQETSTVQTVMDNAEIADEEHHSTPIPIERDRRLIVLVKRLDPVEIKLAMNPKFNKILANPPVVILERLPKETVDAVLRRYAAEDAEKLCSEETKASVGKSTCEKPKRTGSVKRRQLQSEDEPKDESTASQPKKETPIQKARAKMKQRRQSTRPEPVPFLDIPGMPPANLLWNMKIPKKAKAEKATDKADTSSPAAIAKTGASKRTCLPISTADSASSKSTVVSSVPPSYASPLMRLECEKKQKPMESGWKRSTTTRPHPLMSLTVDPNCLKLRVDTSSTNQWSTTTWDTVSSPASVSSRTTVSTNLTTPPLLSYGEPPRKRRVLLGDAPSTPASSFEPTTPLTYQTSPSTPDSLFGNRPLLANAQLSSNWTAGPATTTSGPSYRHEPRYFEENPDAFMKERDQSHANSVIHKPDGTVFDPMDFLNRDDYSDDEPDEVGKNKVNEQRNVVSGLTNDITNHSEPAQCGDHPTRIASNGISSGATASNADHPTVANSLEWLSRVPEDLVADSLATLMSSTTAGANSTGGSTSTATNQELSNDLVESLDTLKDQIQYVLSQPAVENDTVRRQQALEYSSHLDNLKTIARFNPDFVQTEMFSPVVLFINGIYSEMFPDLLG